MEKTILTIGYKIDIGNNNLDLSSRRSLMDADIALFCPRLEDYEIGDYEGFEIDGIGEESRQIKEDMEYWKKEIISFLKNGNTVFLLLAEKKEYYIYPNLHNNYEFLPNHIGDINFASGKKVIPSGNPIFSKFYNQFKDYFCYKASMENIKGTPIFTGKDKTKILGAIHEIEKGHLVSLPMLSLGEELHIDDEVYKDFSNTLINCLCKIDNELTNNSEKTPPPEWATQNKFSTKKSILIEEEIKKNIERNKQLNQELIEGNILKDLLFEQGNPLENAVTKALKILGYNVKNYNDGNLELDQVITSPEKHRFIGECEGKDKKDINIKKLRQLYESINEDFVKDEVKERSFGILFGNPQRLIAPEKRTLDFTEKCKNGADSGKIALIKTADLFVVAQYLKEEKNEEYKKACRDAIYNGLGKVVKFPKIPTK